MEPKQMETDSYVSLEPVVEEVETPIVIREADSPGGTYLFLASASGRITYTRDGITRTLVETSCNSRLHSLMGFELHPEFKSNGKFYLHYSIGGGTGIPHHAAVNLCDANSLCQSWIDHDIYSHVDTVEEWTQTCFCDQDKCLAQRSRVILRIKKPFPYQIAYNSLNWSGRDHRLILSTGDGGAPNDPFNLAQDTASLYGKLISIDVNTDGCWEGDSTKPISNIYELSQEQADIIKILAIGLRSPVSFDNYKDINYVVDSGQYSQSEVNAFSSYPANFGWRPIEGSFPAMAVTPCNISSASVCETEAPDGPVTHTFDWNLSRFPPNGNGAQIKIAPGDRIRFVSTDGISHDLTEVNSGWVPLMQPSFDLPVSTFMDHTVEIDEEGVFFARCNIHPFVMRLAIISSSSIAMSRLISKEKSEGSTNRAKVTKISHVSSVLFHDEALSLIGTYHKPFVTLSMLDNNPQRISGSGISGGKYYVGCIGALRNKFVFVDSQQTECGISQSSGILLTSKPGGNLEEHSGYRVVPIKTEFEGTALFRSLGTNTSRTKLYLGVDFPDKGTSTVYKIV